MNIVQQLQITIALSLCFTVYTSTLREFRFAFKQFKNKREVGSNNQVNLVITQVISNFYTQFQISIKLLITCAVYVDFAQLYLKPMILYTITE